MTPQQEDELLKSLFGTRNTNLSLLENYFKQNGARTDPSSVGQLATICSMIFSELRSSNDILQTFGLQLLKSERDFMEVRNAAVHLLARANNPDTPQDVRSELQNLTNRLESTEKQIAEHKSIVDGIKSYLEKAQQQKQEEESTDFTFLQ